MHNVSLSAAQGFVSDFPANFVHEAQGRPGRSHLWGWPISTSTPPRRRMFWIGPRCCPCKQLYNPGHGMSAGHRLRRGHGMSAGMRLALCRGAGGKALAAPCLAGRAPCPIPWHSADTDTDSDPTRPPLLGGGLCLSGFLGPIYPDKSRQSPTFTQKAMSAAVLFADAAFCRRAFCDNSHNPLNPLAFPHFAHFA